WQEAIRSALIARDVRERAFEPFIRDYSRLAHHANQLRQRNLALVEAASGASEATADQIQTAVRTALITRLESELALARSELSDAYKLQSQHSQRLLTLSEQLHQSDERARVERDQLVEVKAEVERLREAARWHKEIVAEKEKQLVILQDELHSLELELSQLELQNDNLKTDNAALLQRWIHAKTEEARKMNEANAFLEEAKQ
ncbi:autophagy protein 16, partial [Rhodotorula sp. JG-1b]